MSKVSELFNILVYSRLKVECRYNVTKNFIYKQKIPETFAFTTDRYLHAFYVQSSCLWFTEIKYNYTYRWVQKKKLHIKAWE